MHEQIMGRIVQPVAHKLGLPHITWRLLRHWRTTQMVESQVPIKAAQERLGHTRPDILLKHYTHVLDESAEFAATTLSSKLSGKVHKKADSETNIPSIGSQTAARKKQGAM
jgi:integrase